MSKTGRLRKLQLLKSIAASQSRADKLKQETSLNILQTSMMEKELNEMKEHLESLEMKRSMLIQRRDELEMSESSDELEMPQPSDELEMPESSDELEMPESSEELPEEKEQSD